MSSYCAGCHRHTSLKHETWCPAARGDELVLSGKNEPIKTAAGEICVDCGVTEGDIAVAQADEPGSANGLSILRREECGNEMLCDHCFGERRAIEETERDLDEQTMLEPKQ